MTVAAGALKSVLEIGSLNGDRDEYVDRFFGSQHGGDHFVHSCKGTVILVYVFSVTKGLVNVQPLVQLVFQLIDGVADGAGVFLVFRIGHRFFGIGFGLLFPESQGEFQNVFVNAVGDGERVGVLISGISVLRVNSIDIVIIFVDRAGIGENIFDSQ